MKTILKNSNLTGLMVRMRIARQFRKGLLKSRPDVELRFEALLTELSVKFVRQAIFIDFPKFYIVDFYIQSPKRLVVEIDGPHHRTKKKKRMRDLQQDAYFESKQMRLVRFSNEEIASHFESVRNRLTDTLYDSV